MKEIKLSLDKTKKYVVACSFGPDSMALLSLAIKEGLNVVVGHVNYRKRAAAIFEENQLREYCSKRNIKCYVLDLKNVKVTGNFQAWARAKRYEFFQRICKYEHADAVLVAHQQDDLIETYLMQKKRGNFVKKPGISRENEIFGIKIIRPLLEYSKKELIDYDDETGTPYSIDESNLTDFYDRNKIRHQFVEKMTKDERQKILDEIAREKRNSVICNNFLTKEKFLALSYEDIVLFLDAYMQKTNEHRNISKRFVQEIKKAFSSKGNHFFDISNSIRLEQDYDDVFVVNRARIVSYEFDIEKEFKNGFLEIDFSSGLEERGIRNIEQKFRIKNVDKNDEIIINNYSCSIRRLFIDCKVPLFLREVWPGIYDQNGKLLYVPRYRKNFVDNHKSKFIINTKYFTEF